MKCTRSRCKGSINSCSSNSDSRVNKETKGGIIYYLCSNFIADCTCKLVEEVIIKCGALCDKTIAVCVCAMYACDCMCVYTY